MCTCKTAYRHRHTYDWISELIEVVHIHGDNMYSSLDDIRKCGCISFSKSILSKGLKSFAKVKIALASCFMGFEHELGSQVCG